MKTATFLYKCRACGKIEKNPSSSEANVMMIAAALITGNKSSLILPLSPLINLLDLHHCNTNQTGIADLIGYEIREGLNEND